MQADNLLGTPAFSDAVETVRAAYVDRMLTTAPEDRETRDRFYLAIHALNDIEQALTLFVQSGTIEKVQGVKKEKAKNATRDKR